MNLRALTTERFSGASAPWGHRAGATAIRCVALLGVAAFCLWLAWTGFTVSDDQYYVQSGLGWLHQFPYVADHFGRVRAVVGIPIALAVGLFGESEFSVVLSTSVFYAALLCVTFAALSRVISRDKAFVAAMALATVPLFALKATIPSADLPELCLSVVSFWLFFKALDRSPGFTWWLVLSGVAAGLSFSAHEVTSALLLFYGLLFLVGYGIDRRHYFLIGAGFVAVLVAEALYYWIAAGDPLYRFLLLLQGTTVHDRVDPGFLKIASGGTLHVWAGIDPVLMFFTKHDLGIIGYLTVPAMWWAFGRARHDPSAAPRVARLLSVLGIVWLLFAAIALRNLILLPRYYMVAAYCFAVVGLVWLLVDLLPRRRAFAIGCLGLLIAINFAAIAVDNKNPKAGERALVEYVSGHSGTVVTDPMTANSIEWFCRWEHADCSSVVAGPPRPGTPYFHNPANADRANRFVRPESVSSYRVEPQWPILWSSAGNPTIAARALDGLGLRNRLPDPLWNKLTNTRAPSTVRQVPESIIIPAR